MPRFAIRALFRSTSATILVAVEHSVKHMRCLRYLDSPEKKELYLLFGPNMSRFFDPVGAEMEM